MFHYAWDIHTAKVFSADPTENLDSFRQIQRMGSVGNTPPAQEYAVGVPTRRTSYRAGVEYDCFFFLCVRPERSVKVTKTAPHLCIIWLLAGRSLLHSWF